MLNFSKHVKLNYHLILFFIVEQVKKIPDIKKNSLKKYFPPKNSYERLNDFSDIVRYNHNKGKLKLRNGLTFSSDLMLLKENVKNWKIEWNEGKLYNRINGKELMYFHFILSKSKKSFKIGEVVQGKSKFWISKKGIFMV